MKKAFTLIELLIVVAIIGVLSAIMLGVFSGGNEAARNARCVSNMRNLASACQGYAANYGWYPTAGSVEKFRLDSSSGVRNLKEIYSEHPGWISWNSAGAYDNAPTRSCASSGWQISTYDQNEDARMYSLTNGVLWKFVSGNHETYLCPAHVNKMKKQPPNWSYVMNAYFGWTSRPGTESYDNNYKGNVEFGTLKRADKILLFAEIPFAGIGVTANDTTSSGQACDCTLQYRGLSNVSSPETIGFNHKVGKREYCANVVFADGHIEQLIYPRSGMSESELQELTEWLCKGIDVGLNGDKYEKLINDEN